MVYVAVGVDDALAEPGDLEPDADRDDGKDHHELEVRVAVAMFEEVWEPLELSDQLLVLVPERLPVREPVVSVLAVS